MHKPHRPRVVIIGGAMIGSSSAWWLARAQADVTVIEQDPSYQHAATSHTHSCLRQQFGSKINIQLSQFTASFIQNIKTWMGADAPAIALQPFGYMYLAQTAAQEHALRDAQHLQESLGAATRLLSPAEIADAYPFYDLTDIRLGSHNTQNEGYFDGATLFDFFRSEARKAGVRFLQAKAQQINTAGDKVTGVTLDSGETLPADFVVNATGTRANALLRPLGLSLPISPRKRLSYLIKAAHPLDRPLPLTIDPTGVHMRSDGAHYLVGCAPDDDTAVEPDDFEMDHDLWMNKVWPAIATRIPAFEQVKVIREWVGHYDFNELDQNAIVGPHPQLENLILANGFSGHGLQQSPGIGRGIAEWIIHQEWQTLDLSPLSMQRIIENRPLIERNVI